MFSCSVLCKEVNGRQYLTIQRYCLAACRYSLSRYGRKEILISVSILKCHLMYICIYCIHCLKWTHPYSSEVS